MDSPSADSRAMQTRPVFGGGEIEGRKDIRRFAFYSPMVALTRPVRQASEVNAVWKARGRTSLQQTVYLDLTPGAEVDASVHHERENKTRGERCTVSLAVLFRRIDRLAESARGERIQGCWAFVGAVSRFLAAPPPGR